MKKKTCKYEEKQKYTIILIYNSFQLYKFSTHTGKSKKKRDLNKKH